MDRDVYSAETCFVINADNVILDCNGHGITGNKSIERYGILNPGYDNLVVQNCVINNFYGGIYSILDANNTLIFNNTFYGFAGTEARAVFIDGAYANVSYNNITFYELGNEGIHAGESFAPDYAAVHDNNIVWFDQLATGIFVGDGVGGRVYSNTIQGIRTSGDGIVVGMPNGEVFDNIIRSMTVGINAPNANEQIFNNTVYDVDCGIQVYANNARCL